MSQIQRIWLRTLWSCPSLLVLLVLRSLVARNHSILSSYPVSLKTVLHRSKYSVISRWLNLTHAVWHVCLYVRLECLSAALFPHRSGPLWFCRKKCGFTDNGPCDCGGTQTMSHSINSCSLTELDGRLPRLHLADEADTTRSLASISRRLAA